MGTRGKTRLAR